MLYSTLIGSSLASLLETEAGSHRGVRSLLPALTRHWRGSPLSQWGRPINLEISTMKTLLSLALLCFVAATAHAQTDSDREKPLGEDTVKVSDHVWQIVGCDELTFVLPDKTLISGDVVQNKAVPNIG